MSEPVSVVVKLAPDVYMIWAARADAHRTQVHVLLADAATRSARTGLLRHPEREIAASNLRAGDPGTRAANA